MEGNAMNDPTPRTLHNRAIGIRAAGTRDDTDSIGAIRVPAERYWGSRCEWHLQIGRLLLSDDEACRRGGLTRVDVLLS
jgi:fumarate hydratase class II